MNLIYTIETNDGKIHFHYISKKITNNVAGINLTTTESRFLFKLCQSKLEDVLVISRSEMEGYIWGDDDAGIDRKANLNQLVCTLRKKLGQLTSHAIVITQPKKGYSLDDCICIDKKKFNQEPQQIVDAEDSIKKPLISQLMTGDCFTFILRYKLQMIITVVIMLNGYCLYISPELSERELLSTVKKTSINNREIAMVTEDAFTLNCLSKGFGKTHFTNYYFPKLKAHDINDDWRRKLCKRK